MVRLTREKQSGGAWETVEGSQPAGFFLSGLRRIGVGISPYSVAVTPDGVSVFCANNSDNTVSVIVALPYYPISVA